MRVPEYFNYSVSYRGQYPKVSQSSISNKLVLHEAGLLKTTAENAFILYHNLNGESTVIILWNSKERRKLSFSVRVFRTSKYQFLKILPVWIVPPPTGFAGAGGTGEFSPKINKENARFKRK